MSQLLGIAKRQCLEVFGESASKWGVPDLSECVSDKMINIAQQLDDPDVDVTEISMQLVNATDVNTHAQAPFQAGDLKLVVDLIEKISQKSLGTMQYLPPAIRDETIKKITKAIVKSSSNILDDKALESWKFMPEDSRAAEASKLLKGVDGIALYLAKTAVASNAIVSEASNVGEYHSSYLHTNSVWGAIFGGKRNEKLFLILITRPSLALAFLTFAFLRNGLDSNSILFFQLLCKIIAITLHYLFLVSFCWMAVEGVVLYLLLVKIFRTKTRPARDRTVFFTFSWGIPVIVVAVSAVPFYEGYGTEEFCWLSIERHSTWAFVGPVLLICLFNFVCLGKTFMIMAARGRKKKEDTSIEKIRRVFSPKTKIALTIVLRNRYWSKGCALLSCLLGLTWILGVFVVNQDTIFMAYLFNIFNTLQYFSVHSETDMISGSGLVINVSLLKLGETKDENLQKNVEQAETQLFEEQDENQTDGQNELGSCTPTLHQDPEQSRTEHVSLETGMTCSCNSASLSNLPDVIQTDYKENYKAKNDSTV
ncbi:hypothetical protein pdam_00002301 [Pocillopora damicornis]|uniref:G-protein coupled receptors family 2 profile 2 domain-containing protein n=1 Tax=Pocillopora damicornis TaxID=46731 RepID=A0A3M6TFB2_POCDA|nr:hypothetical protein pdam_00002301 [Pocillopora damicornis]